MKEISKAASYLGKKGNQKMREKTTPEQRKEWAKKGGWVKGRPRKQKNSNDKKV